MSVLTPTGARAGRVTAGDRDPGSLWQRISRARWCYLFMAPSLVLAALFTFYPVVSSWYLSFRDSSGTGVDEFVGWANYREVVGDPYFWDAFGRTFLFAFAAVPVMLVLSLVLAVVVNDQALRLRTFFRTVFFLPVVTTTAIVGVVVGMLLNPFDGPLNDFLLDLGVIDRPVDFLGDPDLALWSVAGVFVWKWLGISMIYWLVALQTVPKDVYEAARVDGASGWRLHRHITLPMITPFGVVIALIAFIGALQTFPLMQAMTQGGPAFSTELVEVYIYRLAFASDHQPRLGYASAVAVVFGVTVLLLTLLQAWGLRWTQARRQGKQGRPDQPGRQAS